MTPTRWQRAIDRQIEEARKSGQFDNLPGKGKPLHLNQNPHEDPANRMAYKILKDSNHTLPWIAAGKQIDRDLQAARQSLQRSWLWYRQAQGEHPAAGWVEAEWQRAVSRFRETILELNRRIMDYNLSIPAMRFERLKIDPDREVEAIRNKL